MYSYQNGKASNQLKHDACSSNQAKHTPCLTSPISYLNLPLKHQLYLHSKNRKKKKSISMAHQITAEHTTTETNSLSLSQLSLIPLEVSDEVSTKIRDLGSNFFSCKLYTCPHLCLTISGMECAGFLSLPEKSRVFCT